MMSLWVLQALTEFIGTLFLATGALAGGIAAPVILLPMIFALGPIGGAHFNPIVTTSVQVFESSFNVRQFISYLSVQLVAACVAALVTVFGISPDHAFGPGVSKMSMADFQGNLLTSLFVGEFLGSFALVMVILNVAAIQKDNQYYGLAISALVLGASKTFPGCTFNPAVTIALVVAQKFPLSATILFTAQFAGGTAAAFVSKLLQQAAELKNRQELKVPVIASCNRDWDREYDDNDARYASALLRQQE